MPTILGVNFFGGLKSLRKGRKIRRKYSPSKFAENFAGYFPKIRRTKIKIQPQIRSAEPQDREFP